MVPYIACFLEVLWIRIADMMHDLLVCVWCVCKLHCWTENGGHWQQVPVAVFCCFGDLCICYGRVYGEFLLCCSVHNVQLVDLTIHKLWFWHTQKQQLLSTDSSKGRGIFWELRRKWLNGWFSLFGDSTLSCLSALSLLVWQQEEHISCEYLLQ